MGTVGRKLYSHTRVNSTSFEYFTPHQFVMFQPQRIPLFLSRKILINGIPFKHLQHPFHALTWYKKVMSKKEDDINAARVGIAWVVAMGRRGTSLTQRGFVGKLVCAILVTQVRSKAVLSRFRNGILFILICKTSVHAINHTQTNNAVMTSCPLCHNILTQFGR